MIKSNSIDSFHFCSALWEFMTAPNECLQRRVYNVTAMSFTPEELVEKLYKYVPELRVTYTPDSRQTIGRISFFSRSLFPPSSLFITSISYIRKKSQILADSWPQVFDDSDARRDWKWQPKYNLDNLVDLMVHDVRENYLKKDSNGNGNGKWWSEQQQRQRRQCPAKQMKLNA